MTELFDTTAPMGRMVAQMLVVIAEFERQLIIERTRAGLEVARVQRRVGGRPRALRPEQRAKIIKDIQAGTLTQVDAARLFRVSVLTIGRLITGLSTREVLQ